MVNYSITYNNLKIKQNAVIITVFKTYLSAFMCVALTAEYQLCII